MIDMEIGTDKSSLTESSTPQISANESQSGPNLEKLVTFQLGETVYAIHAVMVAEVSQPLPLTPLPGAQPCLLGVSPLRGEIVANVDLRAMLGEKPARPANPKSKVIVLKRASAGATPIAFAVDRLGEIASVDIADIRLTQNVTDLLIGEISSETRCLKVVDHRKILGSIELE